MKDGRMDIYMTGIDYSNATLSDLEICWLTVEQQKKMAKKLINAGLVKGCLFLSTCNRMELWISGGDSSALEFFIHQVVGEKKVDFSIKRNLQQCFTVRRGEEALEYLFELACGIHSQIFGEDQILSQLKQATKNAREYGSMDGVLETLFRTVITGAKKVKTEVRLTNGNRSLPETIVSRLEERYGALKGKKCLVIGNGEMGRLMASYLVTHGANVEMTLRQYKKKQAIIPSGCDVVLYEERYHKIEEKQYIFSATRSPHYTIKEDEIRERLNPKNHYFFVDMALPRDMDPKISKVRNVTLLHIDDFQVGKECGVGQLEEAREILKEYKQDFVTWYQIRSWAPIVEEISEVVGEQTDGRLTKLYNTMKISSEEKEVLQAGVQAAAKKTVSKLIFDLQEYMDPEQYKELLQGLEQSVKKSRWLKK